MDASVLGQSTGSSLVASSARSANSTLDAGNTLDACSALNAESTLGAGSTQDAVATLDTRHSSNGSSGIQSTTIEKQSNESLQLQPDISFDNLLGCKKCPELSKALKNSKEWIKFFKKKLENTDKLLQVVNELELEKKKYMELQLAYDSRSREWTYTSDQYAQLLLEVQPLKERLLKAEDECKKAIAQAEVTKNKEESLLVSIDQYTAQLAEYRRQYNPNLINKLEKQNARLRMEIKNLKNTINNQKKEIFEMKEFQSNRRIYQERVNKKANWALTLALKYSNKLKELGHEEEEEICERLHKNHDEGIVLMKAQYDTWKSNKLRLYKGNLLKIKLLPSYEEWIDDFDHEIVDEEDEEEEDEEEDDIKGGEISILTDANKLENLLEQRNLKMKIKEEVVEPEVKSKISKKKIVKVKKEKQDDSNFGTKKKKGRPSKKKGDLMSLEELNECIKKGNNKKIISNDVGIMSDSDDTDEETDFIVKEEYNSNNAKNVSKVNNSNAKLNDHSKTTTKAYQKEKNKKNGKPLFRDLPSKYKSNFVSGGILNLNEVTNGTPNITEGSVSQKDVVGISKNLLNSKEIRFNTAKSNSLDKSTERDRIKNKLKKFDISQNRENTEDDNDEIVPDDDLEDYISKVNLGSVENHMENPNKITTNMESISEIRNNKNDMNYRVVPGKNLDSNKERNREDSLSEANLKAIIDEMNSWRCDKLAEFDESFSTDDLDLSLNERDQVEEAISPPSHGRDILEEDLQHSDSEDEFAKPNVLVPMLSTGFSPTLSDSDDNCEENLELELEDQVFLSKDKTSQENDIQKELVDQTPQQNKEDNEAKSCEVASIFDDGHLSKNKDEQNSDRSKEDDTSNNNQEKFKEYKVTSLFDESNCSENTCSTVLEVDSVLDLNKTKLQDDKVCTSNESIKISPPTNKIRRKGKNKPHKINLHEDTLEVSLDIVSDANDLANTETPCNVPSDKEKCLLPDTNKRRLKHYQHVDSDHEFIEDEPDSFSSNFESENRLSQSVVSDKKVVLSKKTRKRRSQAELLQDAPDVFSSTPKSDKINSHSIGSDREEENKSKMTRNRSSRTKHAVDKNNENAFSPRHSHRTRKSMSEKNASSISTHESKLEETKGNDILELVHFSDKGSKTSENFQHHDDEQDLLRDEHNAYSLKCNSSVSSKLNVTNSHMLDSDGEETVCKNNRNRNSRSEKAKINDKPDSLLTTFEPDLLLTSNVAMDSLEFDSNRVEEESCRNTATRSVRIKEAREKKNEQYEALRSNFRRTRKSTSESSTDLTIGKTIVTIHQEPLNTMEANVQKAIRSATDKKIDAKMGNIEVESEFETINIESDCESSNKIASDKINLNEKDIRIVKKRGRPPKVNKLLAESSSLINGQCKDSVETSIDENVTENIMNNNSKNMNNEDISTRNFVCEEDRIIKATDKDADIEETNQKVESKAKKARGRPPRVNKLHEKNNLVGDMLITNETENTVTNSTSGTINKESIKNSKAIPFNWGRKLKSVQAVPLNKVKFFMNGNCKDTSLDINKYSSTNVFQVERRHGRNKSQNINGNHHNLDGVNILDGNKDISETYFEESKIHKETENIENTLTRQSRSATRGKTVSKLTILNVEEINNSFIKSVSAKNKKGRKKLFRSTSSTSDNDSVSPVTGVRTRNRSQSSIRSQTPSQVSLSSQDEDNDISEPKVRTRNRSQCSVRSQTPDVSLSSQDEECSPKISTRPKRLKRKANIFLQDDFIFSNSTPKSQNRRKNTQQECNIEINDALSSEKITSIPKKRKSIPCPKEGIIGLMQDLETKKTTKSTGSLNSQEPQKQLPQLLRNGIAANLQKESNITDDGSLECQNRITENVQNDDINIKGNTVLEKHGLNQKKRTCPKEGSIGWKQELEARKVKTSGQEKQKLIPEIRKDLQVSTDSARENKIQSYGNPKSQKRISKIKQVAERQMNRKSFQPMLISYGQVKQQIKARKSQNRKDGLQSCQKNREHITDLQKSRNVSRESQKESKILNKSPKAMETRIKNTIPKDVNASTRDRTRSTLRKINYSENSPEDCDQSESYFETENDENLTKKNEIALDYDVSKASQLPELSEDTTECASHSTTNVLPDLTDTDDDLSSDSDSPKTKGYKKRKTCIIVSDNSDDEDVILDKKIPMKQQSIIAEKDTKTPKKNIRIETVEETVNRISGKNMKPIERKGTILLDDFKSPFGTKNARGIHGKNPSNPDKISEPDNTIKTPRVAKIKSQEFIENEFSASEDESFPVTKPNITSTPKKLEEHSKTENNVETEELNSAKMKCVKKSPIVSKIVKDGSKDSNESSDIGNNTESNLGDDIMEDTVGNYSDLGNNSVNKNKDKVINFDSSDDEGCLEIDLPAGADEEIENHEVEDENLIVSKRIQPVRIMGRKRSSTEFKDLSPDKKIKLAASKAKTSNPSDVQQEFPFLDKPVHTYQPGMEIKDKKDIKDKRNKNIESTFKEAKLEDPMEPKDDKLNTQPLPIPHNQDLRQQWKEMSLSMAKVEKVVLELPEQYEECNIDYEDQFEELVVTKFKSYQWDQKVHWICHQENAHHIKPIVRALLRVIMRCEPRETKDHLGLPSGLFKLFQVVVVMEKRLRLPPAHMRNLLIKGAHYLICQPHNKLRASSLACLSAWVAASCSIGGEGGSEVWDRSRSFLVDMLQYHPGCCHLALLTAMDAFPRFMLRMTNYRVETALEKVIFWIIYHGPWVGTKIVREKLILHLEKRLAVRNKLIPKKDPIIIASTLLELCAGAKSKSCENAVSALLILVGWQGSHWLLESLMPLIISKAIKIITEEPSNEASDASQDPTDQQQNSQKDAKPSNSDIQMYNKEVSQSNIMILIGKLAQSLQNDKDLKSSLEDAVIKNIEMQEAKATKISSQIILSFKKNICDILK